MGKQEWDVGGRGCGKRLKEAKWDKWVRVRIENREAIMGRGGGGVVDRKRFRCPFQLLPSPKLLSPSPSLPSPLARPGAPVTPGSVQCVRPTIVRNSALTCFPLGQEIQELEDYEEEELPDVTTLVRLRVLWFSRNQGRVKTSGKLGRN